MSDEGIKALGLCFSQDLDRNAGVFMHPILAAPITNEYLKFSLYDITCTHLADLQT